MFLPLFEGSRRSLTYRRSLGQGLCLRIQTGVLTNTLDHSGPAPVRARSDWTRPFAGAAAHTWRLISIGFTFWPRPRSSR